MYIASVIPITKQGGKETLSYFTSKNLALGTLVEVPIRKKQSLAIVLSTQKAESAKTKLRTSNFQLKKVVNVFNDTFISPSLLKASFEIADEFATTPGTILNTIIPPEFIQEKRIRKSPEKSEHYFETQILQTSEENRFSFYRSLIREEFAKKHSLVFCFPTAELLKQAKERLSHGIGPYIYDFYGPITKGYEKKLKKSLKEDHAIVYLITPKYVSLIPDDASVVIIEKENDPAYISLSRPHLDMRLVIQKICQKMKRRCILGDHIISVGSFYAYKTGQYVPVNEPGLRVITPPEFELVDMKKEKTTEDEVVVLSNRLQKLIEENHENNEHLFLYVARKGVAGTTICQDCGELVRCQSCNHPLTLHGKPPHRHFRCHQCGDKTEAKRSCANCKSWRLIPLGIGTEKVKEAINKKFSNMPIYTIDGDSTTRAEARKIRDQFYNSPGSILIGTLMGLNLLEEKVANTAVITLDALFSIPSFTINEKIADIIVRVLSKTNKESLIQTRQIDQPLFQALFQGNLADVYRQELGLRERFDYPPFTTIIKISRIGTKSKTEKDIQIVDEQISELFPEIEHVVVEGLTPKKGSIKKSCIIKKDKFWPDKKMLTYLRSLPPQYDISVHPQDFL